MATKRILILFFLIIILKVKYLVNFDLAMSHCCCHLRQL